MKGIGRLVRAAPVGTIGHVGAQHMVVREKVAVAHALDGLGVVADGDGVAGELDLWKDDSDAHGYLHGWVGIRCSASGARDGRCRKLEDSGSRRWAGRLAIAHGTTRGRATITAAASSFAPLAPKPSAVQLRRLLRARLGSEAAAPDPPRGPLRRVDDPPVCRRYGVGVPSGAGMMPSWTRRP